MLTVQGVQCCQHGLCKAVCILLAGEVEAIDLSVVPPLVKGGSGLVVLESFQYCTVDDNLWHHKDIGPVRTRQPPVLMGLQTA